MSCKLIAAVREMAQACRLQNWEQIGDNENAAVGAIYMIQQEYLGLLESKTEAGMRRDRVAKLIHKASDRCLQEMRSYAGPVASEGFVGGYQQALGDVLLLLESDTLPSTWHFWDKTTKEQV